MNIVASVGDIERAESELSAECSSLEAQLTEARKRLDGLQALKLWMSKQRVHVPLTPAAHGINHSTSINGSSLPSSVPDCIRSVMPRLPDQFSVTDVRREIEKVCPGWLQTKGRTVLSTALGAMKKRGEIVELIQAVGRNPAFYRRK